MVGPICIEIVRWVRLLSIASLVAASLTSPVLVGIERIRDTVILSLISLPSSFVVVLVASYTGVAAVVASALITFPFQAVLLYCIRKRLGIRVIDLQKPCPKVPQ